MLCYLVVTNSTMVAGVFTTMFTVLSRDDLQQVTNS